MIQNFANASSSSSWKYIRKFCTCTQQQQANYCFLQFFISCCSARSKFVCIAVVLRYVTILYSSLTINRTQFIARNSSQHYSSHAQFIACTICRFDSSQFAKHYSNYNFIILYSFIHLKAQSIKKTL